MRVREPAVAGLFYEDDVHDLARSVDRMLAGARCEVQEPARVILAPHAAHEYSGAIAARAYLALPEDTERILILGPSHHTHLQGMALPGVDWHRTPLGVTAQDAELTRTLERMPAIIVAPAVHDHEHSLEVHLPFLQRLFSEKLSVVPLAVGVAHPADVAQAIGTALKFPRTAVIISSDLSHFLSQASATVRDRETLGRVERQLDLWDPSAACGYYALRGAIHHARAEGMRARVIARGDSSSRSGHRGRVVGYAAVIWQGSEGSPPVNEREGDTARQLLHIATSAIGKRLGQPDEPGRLVATGDGEGPDLDATGASFVTLTLGSQLRGCVGSLIAHEPLRDNIRENALKAAFEDTRFLPLDPDEYSILGVEVSVLTTPRLLEEALGAAHRAKVRELLSPGKDGVVLELGERRATFLPSVWEDLPDPDLFLASLRTKAGLSASGWERGIRIYTYRARTFRGQRFPAVGHLPGSRSGSANGVDAGLIE